MVLALVLALLAWDAWRGDLPEFAGPQASEEAAAPPGGGARAETARVRPERDPFRFGAPPQAAPGPAPREPLAATPRPDVTPGPQERVRLVGFIRQGEELRAALSVLGRVALVAEGESVEGYELLDLEQDVGVRVRFPDGAERELRLPPR